MAFKVNFDALDTMYSGIYSQSANWLAALETLNNATTALAESTEMAGSGADSIRAYMSSVHGTVQGLLAQLIQLHEKNNLLYKQDYMRNIDTSLHAVIHESELSSIRSSLQTQLNQAIDVDGELHDAMNRIRDIFTLYYNDVSDVDRAHNTAITFLSDLDESVKSLESKHTAADFTNTGDMIANLTTMIQELIGHNRSYKTDFSMELLAGSETFQTLYGSYLNVSKEIEDKASAIETAIQNENERISDLQEEYEQRQKEAETATWIVTGLCVIGSIAAIGIIVATGGAATPLVVGTVSAVSGAIMAGTNNLANHYVENGNFQNVNWANFGLDVVKGGVTGFVTGYVGASVGGAISSGLSKTTIGASLTQSSNIVTRIGTHAVIGSVSEVSSGIVSRAAGTFVTTLDVGDSLNEALNGQAIVQDAVLGGVNSAVDEAVSLKRAQSAADSAAAKYNNKYDPLEAGEANGLTNLKSSKNGGVDFSDSDYILRTENGDAIQVKIKSTGSRAKDYKLAEQMLKEQGIDIDFKSMRTGDNATHVWHHMDDYDVLTNETTMQFITRDAHSSIENHMGSASQYHVANGKGYGKQAFEADYGFDILEKTSPAINTASDTKKNMDTLEQTLSDRFEEAFQSVKNSQSWSSIFDGMAPPAAATP